MYLKITIKDEKQLFACAYLGRYEQMSDYEVTYISKYIGSVIPEYLYAMLSIMHPQFTIKVRVTKHKKTYSEGHRVNIPYLEDKVIKLFKSYTEACEEGLEDVFNCDNVYLFSAIPFAEPNIKLRKLPYIGGFIHIEGQTFDRNGWYTTYSYNYHVENKLELYDVLEKAFKAILPRNGKIYDIIAKEAGYYEAFDSDGDKVAFRVLITNN